MKNSTILKSVAAATIAICATATIGANAIAADDGNFEVVTDFETFKARFIGPRIMDPEDDANFFVIRMDETVEGTWYGKTLAGDWRWEDQYFCRSLSAPRAAPEDCQAWSFAEGKARLVRNRGTGDETVYSLGN